MSLYFLFPKANVQNWKGLVPGLNFMEWCEIIGRKKWYALWLLVPIVNIFILSGMNVAMAKSFGKNGFWDATLAVFAAPILFFRLAFDKNTKYEGKAVAIEKQYIQHLKAAQKDKNDRKVKSLLNKHPYPKSIFREWVESIFFAVFAAAFIRMFLIEAFVIPTPSMENALNVGDFLFVSKMSYGIRTPQTVAMLPLLHNRVPVLGTESYFAKPSLPYFRFKALNEIERNKKIVFNWPVGDSIYLTDARSYAVSMVNNNPSLYLNTMDSKLISKIRNKDIIVRPIDKKDHYIKRCVGVPGDSLQVINGEVYINGVKSPRPKNIQFSYNFVNKGSSLNLNKLKEWGIQDEDVRTNRRGQARMDLDDSQVEKIRAMDPTNITLTRFQQPSDPLLFPANTPSTDHWSMNDYGPIWIPKKGATAPLNLYVLPLYERIISVYEHNKLEVKDGQIYINDVPANSYTFQQDYYWGMGDNRDNSEDSRSWGYVPHDHIVGEPLFIWFSAKNGNPLKGINWNRIFKSARDQ